MSKVNYHVLNDSVVVTFDGKPQVISRSDKRYAQVIQAIKENRLDDIPKLVDLSLNLEGSGLKFQDGILTDDDGATLPEALNKRILAFREEGLPYEHLTLFWKNVKKNPSFNSRQMLFSFLEHNGHPITQDGCFIAYRGVTEDFKDAHTKTFDNSPGSVCEMPRDQVDDNPNNTCSRGLHVACFDYAKGFASRLVEVKVNPADVVAVPTDYNGTKMRTCRFEVVQECATLRDETLYGHARPAQESDADESEDHEEEELSQEEQDRQTLENGECPECGCSVDEDANFCAHCGCDLEQYS